MMRRNVTLTTAFLVAPILVFASASTRKPAVRLENGTVINSRAGYYFALPQDWELDKTSTYEDVKIIHPGSGATFSVHYDHARGDANAYYLAFIMSFESPDFHWVSYGKGGVTLGGRQAMGLRGTREKDGKKIKEFDWVALVDEYVYLLSSSVTLDQYEARAPEIDRVIATFNWGKPAASP